MFLDHNKDILDSHAIPILPIYIPKKKCPAETDDTQGGDLKQPINQAGKLSTEDASEIVYKRYSGKLVNYGGEPEPTNVNAGSSRGEVMLKVEGTREVCEFRVKTEPTVQGDGALGIEVENLCQVDVKSDPTEDPDCVLGP